jgi:Xaa-Pro aminopeptidase
MDWSARLQRLRDDYLTRDLDAFVVSTPANLTYLSGFAGSAGLIADLSGRARLIVDGRYTAAARQGSAQGRLAEIDVVAVTGRYDETLARVLADLGPARVGYEADHVTVATLRHWQEAAPAVTWVPTERLIARRRMIKDALEIAALRRAGAGLSEIARDLRLFVKEGRSEREVARAIDEAMMRGGFSENVFPTIVASGPNSALPHARPTDRRLAEGDLVVLDFGGRLDGYCGDLTRMAAIGQVGADARRLYDAVREAHAAAVSAVRAGILSSSVDAAARQVLETRGLGEAFLHATGHGLGLDVHEAPRLAREAPDRATRLESGMVCTIEPGAYVDGLGGVRLEDDVLVTAEGCEVLTDAPRDLLLV